MRDLHAKSAVHAVQVLDVNPGWRMNTVSDGQRRRVQLVMGLLKPFKVQPILLSMYPSTLCTICDILREFAIDACKMGEG